MPESSRACTNSVSEGLEPPWEALLRWLRSRLADRGLLVRLFLRTYWRPEGRGDPV